MGGVDAELTEKGIAQVEALRPRAQAMVDAGLELVVIAPTICRRSLQRICIGALFLPVFTTQTGVNSRSLPNF